MKLIELFAKLGSSKNGQKFHFQCSSSTLQTFFLTQLDEPEVLSWRVYPTLIEEGVWVDLPSNPRAHYRLDIYDTQGRQVLDQVNWPCGTARWLSLSHLAEGMYMLCIQSEAGQQLWRRLLKH